MINGYMYLYRSIVQTLYSKSTAQCYQILDSDRAFMLTSTEHTRARAVGSYTS